MEKNWLKLSDIKVLIISRGRARDIISHKLFPFATLVVPESEKKDYEYLGMDIVCCPDEVKGLSLLRNWCVARFKEKVVIMCDDDIQCCSRLDNVTKIDENDPDFVLQVLYSNAQLAVDAGTIVFGFSQSCDVRKYTPCKPFDLNGWVGGVIGVIGKDYTFIDNKLKVDVDFCLEALLHKRIIWKDNRIGFTQIRDRNRGGNSVFRTKEVVEAEKKKLKDKWGRYIKFISTPSGEIVSIKVKRTESYGAL